MAYSEATDKSPLLGGGYWSNIDKHEKAIDKNLYRMFKKQERTVVVTLQITHVIPDGQIEEPALNPELLARRDLLACNDKLSHLHFIETRPDNVTIGKIQVFDMEGVTYD